jgi:hypothetical protein
MALMEEGCNPLRSARTLHLVRADLAALGVDMTHYGERDYSTAELRISGPRLLSSVLMD